MNLIILFITIFLFSSPDSPPSCAGDGGGSDAAIQNHLRESSREQEMFEMFCGTKSLYCTQFNVQNEESFPAHCPHHTDARHNLGKGRLVFVIGFVVLERFPVLLFVGLNIRT